MKKTLLFLILLLSTICFSQITQDYTFDSGYATRIVLENAGEKYYIVNDSNSSITFFNANYTEWKTVNLSVPANTYSVSIQNVSETKINPDDHLEILYTTYSSSVGYQSKIINDLGTVLLTINDCYSLVLDEKDGFAPKLVAKTPTGSDIYGVPNLSIEHSYSTSEAKRIKLEYSGVKYYTFDSTNGIINLYDNDHLFWKNITLTKPDGFTFGYVNFISENDINSDNLIEVGYSYYSNGVVPAREAKIINEIGNTLLTVNNGNSIRVSKLEGLPNKLVAYTFTNSTVSYGTQVFSLPNLILEHTYEGNIFRVKLEISGEKYYNALMGNYNPLNASSYQADIYNSDHSIWKTVSLTVPYEYWTISNIYLSEAKFDTDSQLEVAYTCASNTLDGGHYNSYIVKEDGTNLLTIPDANYLYISEFPNLPTKLLVNIYENIFFDNILTSTNIYNLNGVASAENFNQSIVTIAPNPTSSFLELNAPTSSIKKATIIDLQGKIMEECSGENLKIIDVQNFSCGMYLLILADENNKTSFHKFMVKTK